MRARAAAAAALMLACGASRPGKGERRIALAPCRLKGVAYATLCGSLRVPEDRARPQGRQIELRIAVVPALARAPAPDPLFLLAGGPGQAATEAMAPLLAALERVHRTRDFVLVDQRGTGGSGALRCEVAASTLQDLLSADEPDPAQIDRCLASYQADVRHYTTAEAMQDLDEVRSALGYERINLWGGSYGTRAALVYLRDHGGHARTAILDGAAPFSLRMPLHFARDAQRAMDLLLDHCAQDAGCSASFPRLRARFEQLLARLSAAPARARVLDPQTGSASEVMVAREAFTGVLRGVLYAPDLAVLTPLTLDRAAQGDYGPFVAQAAALEQGFSRKLSLGLLFSVVCSEDAPFIEPAEVEAEARGTFLGPALARRFLEVCRRWPRAPLPPGHREPVHSAVPVLLLSGELDPVTPPAWADLAAATLPNSVRITVPGVGHGASLEGCSPRLIAQLVADGGLRGLDAGCARQMRRPPFFLGYAGPQP